MSFIGPFLAAKRTTEMYRNSDALPPPKEEQYMTIKLATIRKALVAATAVAGELVALGVLHGTALNVAQVVIAAAAAVGVYAVPNAPRP